MATVCPISTERVDNHAARVSGGVVVLVMTIALLFDLSWLPLLLAVDFVVKAVGKPCYSPTCLGARWALARLRVKPALTDAAPKVFAARMGVVMSVLTSALMVAGTDVAARVFGLMLLGCAFLEGAFGYCLGCQIYTLLVRLSPQRAAPVVVRPPERR